MRSKRIVLAIIAVLVILLLTSCANDENKFEGGELLDEEKLSEIRSSVFAEDGVELSTEIENTEINSFDTQAEGLEISENTTVETELESAIDTERESAIDTYSDSLSESELSSDDETEYVSEESEEEVYWTEKGSVWHISEDCRYIKNSNVICGTVVDAIEAGMERACSVCEKQKNQ